MVEDVLVGDLFESQAQALVNTVNCVGVMGKGIALEFKKRFPEMYKDYVARCKAGMVRLGQPYLFRGLEPPWILNFPTKDHWRSVARLTDIVDGLEYLEQHYQAWGITSLAVPPLGCGYGGLQWRAVGPTLYRHLNRFDIPIKLYAPHGTPQEELARDFLAGEVHIVPTPSPSQDAHTISPASVALAEILARIKAEPYHWPVGRTMFQKIAYFATAAGLPTGFHFKKGSYGPFATELKPLLTTLANNGLLREERRGNMFIVETGPTYDDVVRLYEAALKEWGPIIEKVTDLVLRMKGREAEVASTVSFAAHDLARGSASKPSELEVLEAVKRWKQKRRPPITEGEIALAIRELNGLGWLDLPPSPDLPIPQEAMPDF